MDLLALSKPLISTPSSQTNGFNSSRPDINPPPSPSSPPPTLPPASLEQTKQRHARFLRLHLLHHSAQLNSLISSYTKHSDHLSALKLYTHARKAIASGLDSFTVPTVLKACAYCFSLRQGREVHGFAIKLGLDSDVFVLNSLIRMYSDCQDLDSAVILFDEMPDRDIVSWSTMIQSYGSNGLFNKAAYSMREMLLVGLNPSQAAMINMIKVVTDATAFEMGQQIHALVVKNRELSPQDVHLSTALIDMYVKCGFIDKARNMFDRAIERNTASWTAMIAGYSRSGNFRAAMDLFVRMMMPNLMPNDITILILVSDCGQFQNLRLGKWLHAYVIKNWLDLHIALNTALLDMYWKCGDGKSARYLFDEMPDKDLMSWTVMISGYTHSNCFNEAFELFGQMKDVGVKPNEFTIVNLLLLCAEAGALDRGRRLHAFIDQQGIEMDVVLATSLLDMYTKCGEMKEAYKVFNGANDMDVCLWNALLNGLAMNGHGSEAIKLFSEMEAAGIKPNDITFVGLLKACSHSGLVEEGKRFFERLSIEFGLVPRVEHYGCMVDLHGRAGLLDEAYDIIRKMPVSPNIIVWGSLIAACKVHGNLKLGEIAAREILKLDPENVGYRVLLSNIYAAQGRWNEVAEVRRRVHDGGMKKAPALSSIEVNGTIHGFVMGDASHPQAEEIHVMAAEMQRELMRAGHVMNTSVDLLNVEEEEKESNLCFHSEKLAI